MHLATGDLLRAAVAEGTDLGREAKRYMDAGELVPDAVMVGMIRERLSGGTDRFVLDGFPRSVPQADALDALLADLGLPLDAVISIRVSRDELVRRLAGRWICRRCGRSFHEVFNPYHGEDCPAGGGKCDLYQREDDKAGDGREPPVGVRGADRAAHRLLPLARAAARGRWRARTG